MATTRHTTRPPARRLRRRAPAALALAGAFALVAAGCGDGGDDTEAGSGGDDPTISLTQPEDGGAVGDSFDVEVDTDVPIGEPDTGRHHVHLYYDGNTQEGEYDVVYEPTFTVDGLEPGEHTVEAVVANADHSLTDARDEVTVTVGDASGGGSGTTTTTEADETDPGADSPYDY
jgi:hypothetical protein